MFTSRNIYSVWEESSQFSVSEMRQHLLSLHEKYWMWEAAQEELDCDSWELSYVCYIVSLFLFTLCLHSIANEKLCNVHKTRLYESGDIRWLRWFTRFTRLSGESIWWIWWIIWWIKMLNKSMSARRRVRVRMKMELFAKRWPWTSDTISLWFKFALRTWDFLPG